MHSLSIAMAPRRTRHGYTLVELMIVVSIIGISAAAAAPAFSRAMAENRASQAVRELVRMGRRARSETAAYLRAHLVWIQPAANGGTVSLIRGRTNSCLLENWNNLFTTTGPCGGAGAACLETVSFADEQYRGVYFTEMMFEPMVSGIMQPPASTATAICYTPSGVVLHDQPGSLGAVNLREANNNNSAPGGYRFVIRLLDEDGKRHGLVRRMVFPLGAAARGW